MKEIFEIEPPISNIGAWACYEAMLKAHNWGYDSSDDFKIWAEGKSERVCIERLRTRLYELNKEHANMLFWQNSPIHNILGELLPEDQIVWKK